MTNGDAARSPHGWSELLARIGQGELVWLRDTYRRVRSGIGPTAPGHDPEQIAFEILLGLLDQRHSAGLHRLRQGFKHTDRRLSAFDEDDKIIAVTAGTADVLGYVPVELVGREADVIDRVRQRPWRTPSGLAKLAHKQGRAIGVSFISVPRHLGGRSVYVMMINAVTRIGPPITFTCYGLAKACVCT